MLTYTMDVEKRSRWIISTPSVAQVGQPYFCSEVGDFYAHERFMTARIAKPPPCSCWNERVRQQRVVSAWGVLPA